jgi:hypothetical protein
VLVGVIYLIINSSSQNTTPIPIYTTTQPPASSTQTGGQAINCVVSDWSNWGTCSKTCGGGTQQRTKSITTQPQNGGRACPPSSELTESQTCNTQSCPQQTEKQDCVVNE